MDEPTPQPRLSTLNRDWPWLVALLLIVAALRGYLIYNTEVTARDSIGFIRYSLHFDRMLGGEVDYSKDPPLEWTWRTILKTNHQHPGYPMAVWIVSKPLRAAFGFTPEVMRHSAQLVSMIASLLLAFVMFRLGSYLWDRHIGFLAALLYQCLPVSGHHLSDGISDGLCLLLVMSALNTLLLAWDTGSLKRYALGGMFVGLAYLTRPEGLLVLPAAWLFVLGAQCVKSHAKPWRQTAFALVALTLGWAVAGSPYYLATGSLSIKPSVDQFLAAPAAHGDASNAGPLFASIFGATFAPASGSEQLRLTLRALAVEWTQSLHYVGAVLVAWGVLFCRKTLTRNFGVYLLVAYFAIDVAILVSLGLTKSYVSDRHVMPLVALSCYPCIVGVLHLCTPWSWYLNWGRAEGSLFPRTMQIVGAVYVIAFVAFCTTKTATRLHGNRAGNHQAGLWLAKNAQPEDMISDDHNWSQFYSGHLFLEGHEPAVPEGVAPTHYHVMTRSKEDGVREKRETQEESLKQQNAKLVYHWPTNVEQAKARIVIYALPRNFETNPWVKIGGPNVTAQPVSRQR